MATKANVILDVYEDLIVRIGQTDPGIEPQILWHPYEGNEDKEPDQGQSRSYTIRTQSDSGVTFGFTTTDYETIFVLEVKYEKGPIWTLAAADDYDAIVSALQRTWTLTSLPTGLDFYTIGEMSLTEDEFFTTMTVPITARIAADVRS